MPQGSILGPILFIIFRNDLFYFIKGSNLHNFADDNTLSNNADCIEELITDNADCIEELITDNADCIE